MKTRLFVFYNGLRRRQARDGHAERRAGHIVEAGSVAEFHRGRVAAVFAADAELESGLGLAAQLHRHFNQPADALLVNARERVVLEDLLRIVVLQELAGVVAGEAESHLGQVVRAEGEEVGFGRDLVRALRSWCRPYSRA